MIIDFPEELNDIESKYYREINDVPNEYQFLVTNYEARMSRMAHRMLDLYSKVGQYGVTIDLIRRDFEKSYNSLIKEFYHSIINIIASKNGIEDKNILNMAYDYIIKNISDNSLLSAIRFSYSLEEQMIYLNSALGRIKTKLTTNIDNSEINEELKMLFLNRVKQLNTIDELELFDKNLNNFLKVREFNKVISNKIVLVSSRVTNSSLFKELCAIQNRLSSYLIKCVRTGNCPNENIVNLFNSMTFNSEEDLFDYINKINGEFNLIEGKIGKGL